MRDTVRGSAQNGIDFETLTGSAVIPPGQTSAEIVIAPLLDGLFEGNEYVELMILPRNVYAIVQSTASLVIEDEPVPVHRVEFVPIFDGTVMLGIFGEPGRTYIVQSSTDLKEWSVVSTNRLDSNPVLVNIPPFDLGAQRFYRSAMENQSKEN